MKQNCTSTSTSAVLCRGTKTQKFAQPSPGDGNEDGLAVAGVSPEAMAPRKRIAAVVTAFYEWSHGTLATPHQRPPLTAPPAVPLPRPSHPTPPTVH